MIAPWAEVPRRYLDEDVLTRERERCFVGRWTYAGLSRDLGAHGDWITLEIGGQPVFVQNHGGALSAFSNVCAHRHSALRVGERGNGPIQCPYHRWSYDADGALASSPTAPELMRLPMADRQARWALERWGLERCGELIFVAREPSTDLRADLGIAFDRLAALSKAFDRELWRKVERVQCNWKLLVQNTLEVEHVPSVHPETFGRVMPRPIVTDDVEAAPPHVAYCARTVQGPPIAGDSRTAKLVAIREAAYARRSVRDVFGYLHYLLFPNTTFATTDGRIFGIFRYEPLSSTQTRVEMRVFETRFDGLEVGERAALDLEAAGIIAFTDRLAQEDAVQCEAVQRGLRGLRSPAVETYTHGERAVQAFHEHYLRAMED